MRKTRGTRRGGWVQKVTTVSTFPPAGTFSKSGEEIARIMARPSVSPKGLGSAIRMVVFFKNRSGKALSPARRAALDRAIRILQQKLQARRRKTGKAPARRGRGAAST